MTLRILLVDDSPTVFEFVRGALSGHDVHRLENFVDLPGYLRGGEPHAVILDVHMPGISGQAFARFLRRCTPKEIPIILYSSVDEDTLHHVGREVGARAVLRKDGNPQTLRGAIQDLSSWVART